MYNQEICDDISINLWKTSRIFERSWSVWFDIINVITMEFESLQSIIDVFFFFFFFNANN